MEITQAGLSLTVPDGWCSLIPGPTSELVASFIPLEDAGLRLDDCPCGSKPEDLGGHFLRTVAWLPVEKKEGNER
jgi:hypothetical protein